MDHGVLYLLIFSKNAKFKAYKIFFVNSQMFLTPLQYLLIISFLYLIFTCLNYLDNWGQGHFWFQYPDNLYRLFLLIYSTEVKCIFKMHNDIWDSIRGCAWISVYSQCCSVKTLINIDWWPRLHYIFVYGEERIWLTTTWKPHICNHYVHVKLYLLKFISKLP